MNLSPPEAILSLLSQLNEKGYSAYLVGGCVRDFLRGSLPQDWDVTTNALPNQVAAIFQKTYMTGKQHGTVTVVHEGTLCEVTTYRIDGEYTDHRRPKDVFFTDDLKKDLARRDFTINAMAWHPREGIQDFFGGQGDLNLKLLRTVGRAKQRFTEDALRILRGVRFAASLNFTIEEETAKAMASCANLLSHISAERKREEFLKMLFHSPALSCHYLSQFGLLSYLSSGLTCSKEAMVALERLKNGHAKTALALLLFFQEDPITPLFDLKCKNEIKKNITLLLSALKLPLTPTFYEIKKIMGLLSSNQLIEDFFKLKEALGNNMCEVKELYREVVLRKDPYSIKDLRINGSQLSALGIQGEEIGHILNSLLEQVLHDPTKNSPDLLLSLVNQLRRS